MMAKHKKLFVQLAVNNFSEEDPNQLGKVFILRVENRINFSFGSQLADNAEKKTRNFFSITHLFPSLQIGPAAEWYADTVDDSASWAQIRTAFDVNFSNDPERKRQRITTENCVRRKEQLIKKFIIVSKAPLTREGHDNLLEPKSRQIISRSEELRNTLNIQNLRTHTQRIGEKGSGILDRATERNMGGIPNSSHFQSCHTRSQFKNSTQGYYRSKYQPPLSETTDRRTHHNIRGTASKSTQSVYL